MSSSTSLNLNYLRNTGLTRTSPVASQQQPAPRFQQPILGYSSVPPESPQHNRIQQQFYSSDCTLCTQTAAPHLNDYQQVASVNHSGKLCHLPSAVGYSTLQQVVPARKTQSAQISQSNNNKQLLDEPRLDNSVEIAYCQRPGCDECGSDMDDSESEQRGSSAFNYEPILSKILNEKKLALSRSPQVIKFLTEEAARPPPPSSSIQDKK